MPRFLLSLKLSNELENRVLMSNPSLSSPQISPLLSSLPLKLACVDTSTFTESIALVEGDEVKGERLIRRPRGHASGLHRDLDDLLKELEWELKDLDGVVCGLGPGSFTGMRVGLAAFKGLAYALECPLYGVPTPYALLHAARHPQALSLIDARRGEVYAHGYGFETPRCLSPQDLVDHLNHLNLTPSLLIGEGALAHQSFFKTQWPTLDLPLETAFHCPRASFLVPYITEPSNLDLLEPIYVRKSDAEINYPDGFPSEARLFKNK